MNGQQGICKGGNFTILANAAATSMILYLTEDSRTRSGEYIAIMSESRVALAYGTRGSGTVHNLEGEPITGTLIDLVKEKALDPKCKGLVPLTKLALRAVKHLGLKPFMRGIEIPGLNYRAVLYKK